MNQWINYLIKIVQNFQSVINPIGTKDNARHLTGLERRKQTDRFESTFMKTCVKHVDTSVKRSKNIVEDPANPLTLVLPFVL